MKILNREEFFKLPQGVLYSEYEPDDLFYNMFIKGEQLKSDYVEMSIIGNIEANSSDERYETIDSAKENKNSIKLDFEKYGRNGMYDEEQLYALYEKQDLEDLIKCLQKSLEYYDK